MAEDNLAKPWWQMRWLNYYIDYGGRVWIMLVRGIAEGL